MRNRIVLAVLVLASIVSYGFTSIKNDNSDGVTYKCLIQLTNYGGEGAYLVLSLINPDGEYVKTLSVNGDDQEWYEDMPTWFNFYTSKKEKIDGITGASILSGGRKVATLNIDAAQIGVGYKLRFESAVEDNEYYEKDLEIELDQDVPGKRLKGNGYIRYVQLIKK